MSNSSRSGRSDDEPIGTNQKQQYHEKISYIASDRLSEEATSDALSIRRKQQTPLSFYFYVGDGFLISFRKKQLCSFITRFICVCIIIGAVSFVIQVWAPTSHQFKAGLFIFTFLHLASFCLLFFLDPGTLFEDEDEKLGQQRLYCQICEIYKSEESKHCVFCNKCVANFDHHCSFFGKCIARRNYLLFVFFIVSSVLTGFAQMGTLLYTLFKSTLHND